MAQGLRSSAAFLIGSLFFFLLSFAGMGLAPWTTLRNVIPRGGASPYDDPKVKRGREVYIREACWHCHSQFVRPIGNEDSRYGPVSETRESGWDVPQLFGTRRIGPDLAREAGRRPDDWHIAHLHDPRFVVPRSVMPAFPWLFGPAAGDSLAPAATADGEALVAYLQQIGNLKADEISALVHPGVDMVEGAPASTPEYDRRGAQLFERHCIGCHGGAADGRGPARRFLNPPPENLTAIRMLPEEGYRILAGGVKGSSMPSWRELSHYDLWALAHRVVRFYRGEDSVRAVEDVPAPPAVTPGRLAAGREAFAGNCAICHGDRGRGDGAAASALLPRPPNFERYRPSVKWSFKVITNGYGRTMPPWGQLPEETRWNLALHVHSLWRGDTSAVAGVAP
jgi:cbb3-type cytochrome oxidase cytochrome c subunit